VTAIGLLRTSLTSFPALSIFAAALFVLYRWQARGAVATVVLAAGLAGLLVFQR
jgi:hypothetical protein